MATINYFVRSKIHGRLATIHLQFTESKKANFFIPTEFKVLTEAWAGGMKVNPDPNKKVEPVSQDNPDEAGNKRKPAKPEKIKDALCNDVFTKQDARNLLNSLGNLRMFILNNYRPGMTVTKEWITKLVYKFHHPEDDSPKSPETLNQFVDRYIDEAETGYRLTVEGQRFSVNTVKSLKSWKMNFEKYQKEKGITINFNDVHVDLYGDLLRYFYDLKFRTNTIGKFIKSLKTFMNAAKDEGLHSNVEYLRKAFKAIHNEVDTIFLTEDEVNSLYNLEIEDDDQRLYRDVFLVGVYTAQRFSDYHRISQGNVQRLNNGALAIQMRQKKTGAEVQIPCRPELVKILKRYDYNLTKTHEQYVNTAIKGICRQAKITGLVEISEQIGGYTVKKTVEKCTLVCTHTARRTGATLMYLSGIPSLSIMKLTGHKTEREFLKYIRLDSKGTAEVLSTHEYYQPKPKLKIV